MNQKIEKKTILYVSNDAGMGGAGQSLVDMLRFMGRFVTPIVVIPSGGQVEEILKTKNIKYYIINISRGLGKIGQHTADDDEKDFVINYEAAIKIRKIIKDNNVDLVHINSGVSNAGAIAALLSEVPYVWHLREVLEQHFGYEFLDKRLKQALFDAADGLIAISEWAKQDYKEKYKVKPIKLYNIIDSERFKEELSNRKEHNILNAGHVTEAKGQLDAIKAIKILVDNGYTDVKLYIVGSCDRRFKWCFDRYINKHGLEYNIVLLPFMEDLSEIRRQCMISLTTSKYEALGRVTVEAMLAGNIVIGCDTGETPQLIGADGERGYLYKMGDATSLADTIIKVLNKEGGHNELLIRAQNFAEITFAGISYAEKLNQYYDKILKEHCKTSSRENAINLIGQKYKELRSRWNEFSNNAIITKKSRIAELQNKWKAGVVANYLKEQNITSVAIYGMGELGCRLYDELTECGVDVTAVIDRNPYFLDEIIKVYSPNEELTDGENIISTVVSDFNEVKSAYKDRNVINLIEIIEYTIQ